MGGRKGTNDPDERDMRVYIECICKVDEETGTR